MNDIDCQDLEAKTLTTIRLCLANDVMYHVMDEESPTTIWLKLENDLDLSQHINVFNQIISDLKRVDVKFEDEDNALMLLNSLPASSTKKANYESSQGEGLLAKSNQERGKTKFWNESKKKKEDLVSENKEGTSKSTNIVAKEDSESGDGDMLSVSSNSNHLIDSWILDSTCSYHMTLNKDWFNTYRHVPDLRKNLISLGTLDCNGFSYKSTSGVMKVSKGVMTVMKGQKLAGNIYKLLGTTIVGGVATVKSESNSTILWHMQLGHMGERGMMELHKRNLLKDIKTYTFAKFKLWKTEVENQTMRKIKCLRSDNGTEYTDSKFTELCEQYGIKRHFTLHKKSSSKDQQHHSIATDKHRRTIRPLTRIGYKICEYDCFVYVKSLDDDSFIFILLYVDDMLIVAKSIIEVNKLKSLLSKEFDMKDLGMTKKILGMEIHKDKASGRLWLSQHSYVKRMLERFNMDNAKTVPYASAVGCLMYVMVCTIPDLTHVVSVETWMIGGLPQLCIHPWWGPICWKSMIQSLVALSTNESEYMVVAEAINESLWLTGLVKELGIQQSRVQLYYDSESAIYLAKNQVYHARTKHIDVRFHKIRELVSSSELVLEKVHTSDNAVDMLTKLITIEKFKHFLNLINVSKC
ncbi:Retrovirus-related Pol polyprotein from transposon TNT 1-94 [Vitis vinifera]|uniref:Retrovirus-related Pol polyprotein from transposon TNT 1-94 n=1 Tax=Vitis vinifera TaxID=29760 RepID=A0A438KFH1_VITVI|nr:Retrovirus-related Pol polyprotein from transposon TNT 1-94 [Vitis vinifera]